jgi:hypothetical protein
MVGEIAVEVARDVGHRRVSEVVSRGREVSDLADLMLLFDEAGDSHLFET